MKTLFAAYRKAEGIADPDEQTKARMAAGKAIYDKLADYSDGPDSGSFDQALLDLEKILENPDPDPAD